MIALQYANMGLRFLLELCALAALGYWGFQTGNGLFFKIALGIGAPLLAAVVWGLFGSPGASMPVQGAWHLLLAAVVFGSAAIALFYAGRPALALTFGLALLLNRIYL